MKISDIEHAFLQNRKSDVMILRQSSCKKSKTRTKCQTSYGEVITNGDKIPVFIKYSPCEWIYEGPEKYEYSWAMNTKFAQQSPNYVEVNLFTLVNKLKDMNICDTFVYSYNDTLLKSAISNSKKEVTIQNTDMLIQFLPKSFVKGPRKFVMLITQPLEDYYELEKLLNTRKRKHANLRLEEGDLRVIFFQIIYTIQCMTHINMAHMDLHFGNIFVKYLPSLKGKFKEYTYMNSKGKFNKVYVPAHYDVKIIDLDGAHKLKTNNNVENIFSQDIKNENIWSGKVKKTNPRVNLVKIMHELYFSKITKKFIKEFEDLTNNHGLIPYFNKNIFNDPVMSKINAFLGDYGILFNEKGNVFNIDDSVIYHPSMIMEKMAKHFTTKQQVIMKLSQERIFKKKSPIPSSIKY